MQKFVDSGKKLTLLDIQGIGINFPKDLVDLYLHYNGGKVDGEKDFYIDEDNDVEVSVQTFLPMKYKRFEFDTLLEEMYQMFAMDKKLIPISYIPFAVDYGGYPYCINTLDHKIYIGYMDDYDGTPESTIRFISNSLAEFIDGMMSESEAY
ncbi:SMI1/KNR4 family protein [Xylocopilactobacillus apicola]|uniref:Knr4/Smi1-like domain-containing protein n=1 Tax=Xylocopilactobacillus apicola TaxID=2932184 RepID=A0AAU9CZ45_9LACO|nr:SMI1/KNR4 family protein [Xylocopilactobacillus apicola]BDR57696.1 hypothetical protein XA3_01370 [Xylocopilactobacillus apicola]